MSTHGYPMRLGLIGLFLGLALSSPYSPRSAPAQAAPASPDATVEVAERDDRFIPAELTVPIGTVVRWTNMDDEVHTTTSTTGRWNSGDMGPGATYSVAFTTPGTFLYRCNYHAAVGMVGRVVVTSGGTPPPGPGPGGNLALGKPIRASSAQAGHPPAHAVDGNLDTFWASAFGPYAAAAEGDESADRYPGAKPATAPELDPAVAPDKAPELDLATEPDAAVAPAEPAAYDNQWIYVDLGATQPVARMHMVWTAGRHARVYGIYVYNAACGGWCQIGATGSGDGDDTLTLSRPINGRVFLLQLAYSAMPSSGYELREWEIFGGQNVPPPASTNVALGRPAFASSTQAGFAPGLATDGDPASEWRSGRLPAYIFVDFGRVMWIDRAVLRWAAGLHATRFGLYAWNGYGWYAIFARTNGAGEENVEFRTVATRYLLLYAIAGREPIVGLREFEVYGVSSGNPYPYGAQSGDWPMAPEMTPPALVPEGLPPDQVSGGMVLDADASELLLPNQAPETDAIGGDEGDGEASLTPLSPALPDPRLAPQD